MQLPLFIYQDEDWIFIAECPLIKGFHTFWKNLEELYANVEEVKELFSEEILDLDIKNKFYSLSFLNIKTSNVTSTNKLKAVV